MAAGDVNILGPFNPDNKASIDTALTGAAVVADTVVPYYNKAHQVYFVVIKAA